MDIAEVLTGRLSVRRVFGLVERLKDEPMSRFRAKLLGGDNWREHLGWTPQVYVTAALVDAVQANSAITAAHGSKKRPKQPDPFYRPPLGADQPPASDLAAAEVDDFELAQIEALINS